MLESAQLLYDAAHIDDALDQLATQINAAVHDDNPLLLCVLIGGIVITGRLMPKLAFPCEVGYVHATRYRNEVSGHDMHWIADIHGHIEGRVVLIIDDILDEGITLREIENRLKQLGASRVLKAVLVKKRRHKAPVIGVDFFGLEVPDRYVFGCGMDYKGHFRNLPDIYALADTA